MAKGLKLEKDFLNTPMHLNEIFHICQCIYVYIPIYCFYQIGIWALPITVVTVCILSSVGIGRHILTVLSPSLMAVGSLMPAIGFTFGYVLSVLFKLSQA